MELDKIDTLSIPNFRPAERELILNMAQERYIVGSAKLLELNQDVMDSLRTLVSTVTLLPTQVLNNYTQFAIPSDYRRLIRPGTLLGTGIVCGINNIQSNLKITQVTHDRLNILLEDPFHKPDENNALMLIEGANLLIYTNGLSVNSITITYLREPLKLSLSATGVNSPVGYTSTCELPFTTHREIVADAVRHTLESIESPRYKTNTIESQI